MDIPVIVVAVLGALIAWRIIRTGRFLAPLLTREAFDQVHGFARGIAEESWNDSGTGRVRRRAIEVAERLRVEIAIDVEAGGARTVRAGVQCLVGPTTLGIGSVHLSVVLESMAGVEAEHTATGNPREGYQLVFRFPASPTGDLDGNEGFERIVKRKRRIRFMAARSS